MIWALCICVAFCQCTGQSSHKEQTALEGLSNAFQISLQEVESVVVIPAFGCDECISGGEELLLQELDKEKSSYSFIITGYESRKDAMIRFKTDPTVAPFIHLDTLMKFNKEPYVTSAPKVFMVDNGVFTGEGEIQFDGTTYMTR